MPTATFRYPRASNNKTITHYYNYIMATGKRLHRSSDDKWIAGVCGGFAEYLDWDPTLIRLAWLFLTVFSAGFPGLLIYIFLWICMPK